MQNIDMRFSFDGLDLPGMQRGVSATIAAIEKQVLEGVSAGTIDEKLLRASLHALTHAAARAQQEYERRMHMGHAAHEYRQVDLAVGQQIKDQLLAERVTSYPMVCAQCRGQRILGGEACPDCAGNGSYCVAV